MNPPRLLEGDELLYAVAGILMLYHALWPDQPVVVQRELEKMNVVCTTEDVHNAVRNCRRRGLNVDAEPRRTGYLLLGWLPSATWRPRGSLLPSVAEADDTSGQLDGQN